MNMMSALKFKAIQQARAADTAPRSGIGAQFGYVTRLQMKPISEKSRRVSRVERWAALP